MVRSRITVTAEATCLVDEMEGPKPMRHADLEIFHAVVGCGVHEPRARLVGHVCAYHHWHLAA